MNPADAAWFARILPNAKPKPRPRDLETGKPVGDTLNGLRAWTPQRGDIAAATQYAEAGTLD